MSIGSIEEAVKNFFSPSGGLQVDLEKAQKIVDSLVAAAPRIEQGATSTEPFLKAIALLVQHQGSPDPKLWGDLAASMDAAAKGAEEVATATAEEVKTVEQVVEEPTPAPTVAMPGDSPAEPK